MLRQLSNVDVWCAVKYMDNEEQINVQSLIQAQLRFCHGCRMPVRLGTGYSMRRKDVDKVCVCVCVELIVDCTCECCGGSLVIAFTLLCVVQDVDDSTTDNIVFCSRDCLTAYMTPKHDPGANEVRGSCH